MTIANIRDLQTRSARLRRARPLSAFFASALGLRHSFRLIRG
jgi:hypothetical protein